MSTATLNESTRKFVRETLETHLAPLGPFQVFLFGSYARGNPGPNSDIDIAVRTKAKIPLSVLQAIETAFEESYIPQRVDLVDYDRVSEGFRSILDQTAILIHTYPPIQSRPKN